MSILTRAMQRVIPIAHSSVLIGGYSALLYAGEAVATDYLTYGRESDADENIKRLIKEKGLCFHAPTLWTQRGNGQTYAIGMVDFGRKGSGLANEEVTLHFIGNEVVLRSSKLNLEKSGHFDPQTMQAIHRYCMKTLTDMHSVSFCSAMLGFKTASEKIMNDSALRESKN